MILCKPVKQFCKYCVTKILLNLISFFSPNQEKYCLKKILTLLREHSLHSGLF